MRMTHILIAVLAILIIGAGFIYANHFRPIPPFQPTGEYSAGTTSFDFEFRSGNSNSSRKINIRAWYPSGATAGAVSLVSSQRLVDKTVEYYKMPKFMAVTEPSLSFKDALIAVGGDRFPVLVFNHGFGSFAEQNTVNMQELASNGYIVLSLSHPETSLLTEYTDGTYVYNNPDLPAYAQMTDMKLANIEAFNAVTAAITGAENASSFEEYWQGMRTLGQTAPYANMQPFLFEWTEDSNALINAIAEGELTQMPEIFAARMDIGNIAIFGHSLGGMTALATALSNPNIKAVINLDGPMLYDDPIENIATLPPSCMLMASGILLDDKVLDMSEINTPLVERSDQGGCVAVFKGAWHMNFTDLNYIPFLRLFKVLGPADQEKFGIELNRLLVSFFDRHLKGNNIPYEPVYDSIVEYREY